LHQNIIINDMVTQVYLNLYMIIILINFKCS
jgi:hypothetical protein